MATLNITTSATFTDDNGNACSINNGRAGKTLTLTDGEGTVRTIDVDATTTVTLWTLADPIAAFQAVVLVAVGEDLMLELITDSAADVGTELFTMLLAEDVPFVLGGDDSYANYTTNFGGGTLDKIESIRVRNLTSNDASVKMMTVA